MDQRVESGGRIGQSRQQCRLCQIELGRGRVEVHMRRRLDAGGRVTIGNVVQVGFQDLALGHCGFEMPSDEQLSHLARDRAGSVKVFDLGELLSDGARTLQRPLVSQVVPSRGEQSRRIERALVPEISILDIDGRLLDR